MWTREGVFLMGSFFHLLGFSFEIFFGYNIPNIFGRIVPNSEDMAINNVAGNLVVRSLG